MSSRQFVELWGDGDNSFADNPPNAVLSFAEPGDRLPTDAVVVIQDPRLDGDVLSYSIKLLDGSVPSATGACARSSIRSVVPCRRCQRPGCIGERAAGDAFEVGTKRAAILVRAGQRQGPNATAARGCLDVRLANSVSGDTSLRSASITSLANRRAH